ncbi:unnamed protein product [Rotaria magnacalcarata]|uniref:Uncharacterized protein n=2 Tax=Rotaria magnacalcarata TaxID=392030 RepID=A0A814UC86_9BILA|nr:unnamed protein product [Rotaria magnacalcarata]CAF1585475.1 unnamed protein product [Rotaria magnacalcarata]CAF2045288.1 unnamed protein product [Rotaria magnacalcarata]CAF2075974.1 unnamed protein product [Rotaria magnacalcarata]CAF2159341.1 unnamed protein product [Rotaria magnacalcarata]
MTNDDPEYALHNKIASLYIQAHNAPNNLKETEIRHHIELLEQKQKDIDAEVSQAQLKLNEAQALSKDNADQVKQLRRKLLKDSV